MSASPLHWIEILSAYDELIRVGCVGTRYVYRVVPHRARSWVLESKRADGAGGKWARVCQRSWYKSPRTAMQRADELWADSSPPTTSTEERR